MSVSSIHVILSLKGLAGPDSSGMSLQYPYHRSKDIADHPGAGEAQGQCGQGELGPKKLLMNSFHFSGVFSFVPACTSALVC